MDHGGTQPHERLEQAARQRREAQTQRARLEAAEQHADATAARVVEARDRLADEDRDVRRQESLSWSRILSSLRGSHATDHDREVAERDAARYAVSEAEARDEMAARDVLAAQSRLDELGDVEAGYQDALTAQERWAADHDSETAATLARISQRRGALQAEDTEAREAHAAGMVARDHLLRARRLLDGARSWSTWDTFGGGGMFTDMMKYDRLDEVAVVLRDADVALGRFSRELADLRLSAVEAVNLPGMTRAFDVFFDNIFSDLQVRSRIQDAEVRVADTLASVEQTLQGLTQRGHEIAGELEELAARREQALLG